MGEMGYGYGSECHLLRWMGRHRQAFNRAVLKQLGLTQGIMIDWLDQPFDESRTWPDGEWRGIDFLEGSTGWENLRRRWIDFWPQRGTPPTWDAVGWLSGGMRPEVVLVEAKAHLEELENSCGAGEVSRAKIRSALVKTAEAFRGTEVPLDEQWLKSNYQFANRLAVRQFLEYAGIPCRLLFVYFTGEKHEGWKCPVTREDWAMELHQRKSRMGLPPDLKQWSTYEVFLPVVDDSPDPLRWPGSVSQPNGDFQHDHAIDGSRRRQ